MFTKSLARIVLSIVILLAAALFAIRLAGSSARDASAVQAASSVFDSPLPAPTGQRRLLTPTPPPSPTPLPQAQVALGHIAEREGIPLENLVVTFQRPRSFPLLGRRYMTYTILDRVGRRSFHLLVGLEDYRVVDDVAAVERAEVEAQVAKYGKLEPTLYARLQTAGEDEALQVAIWVGGQRGRSEAELYAILAARYPEASAALAQHRLPFDVPNRALGRRIEDDYLRLRQEDIAARIASLLADLKRWDIPAEASPLLPSVNTTLTKTAVLELARREDIEIIYLVEGSPAPALDTAVRTNRVGPLWRGLGVEGIEQPQLSVTIAIVEQGNVELSNTYLRTTLRRLVAPNPGQPEHMTRVASAAASFHPLYRGMAPGAFIISAGHWGPATDQYAALNWALDQLDPQPGAPNETVRIANVSEARDTWPDNAWATRAFDYAARARNATIAAAAGNVITRVVTSPAAGWNIIGAGGINDRNTTDWSDDTMYRVAGTDEGSSYLNTVNVNEKPEMVAPAQGIVVMGPNNIPSPPDTSGTSYAAPQVAGLAALLMLRNQEVRQYPTALKAILMASAVHNIEGDSRLSDQDGAGSIDAALANTIVGTRSDYNSGCATPCWWSIATTSNFPSPGQALVPSPGNGHSFAAARGERVRVAVAWWSEADPPLTYPFLSRDALTSNFDLRIWSPTTQFVAASGSLYDNFEIVDFVAAETGWYRLEVIKNPYGTTEASNTVGIAWVKDAAYLPDLRNRDGWASDVYVRNDAIARTAAIHYFDANGAPTPKGADACYLTPNQWCWIPVAWENRIPAGTAGAAIVDSGEELSVLVESQHAGYTMAAAYSGAVQPATTAYLPAFYKVATISSLFTVHNPAPAAATVSMAYRDRNGADQGAKVVSLPAGGSRAFDPYNCNDVPPAVCAPGFVDGAVRITADQPIAALATTLWKTNNVPYEAGQYSAPTVGRATLYAASQYRLCTPDPDGNCSPTSTWTLYSAVILHNLTGTAANVTLRYYRRDPVSLDLTLSDVIPAYGARGYNTRNGGSVPADWFNPLGAAWDGTVRITSDQAVAGVVNTIWVNLNAAGSYSLAGSEDGRAAVIFPLQAKQAPGGVWQRWAALNVMNVGSQSVSVNVHYYDALGNHVFSLAEAKTLGPYQAFGLNTRTSSELNGLPADFVCSAVAQTVAPALIGVANVLYPDRAAVYDGVGR